MFALIMGVAYQFKHEENTIKGSAIKAKHATSLYYKGVSLFKTVCGISTEKVW